MCKDKVSRESKLRDQWDRQTELPSEQINLPSGAHVRPGLVISTKSLEPRGRAQYLGWKRAAREALLYKHCLGGAGGSWLRKGQRGEPSESQSYSAEFCK